MLSRAPLVLVALSAACGGRAAQGTSDAPPTTALGYVVSGDDLYLLEPASTRGDDGKIVRVDLRTNTATTVASNAPFREPVTMLKTPSFLFIGYVDGSLQGLTAFDAAGAPTFVTGDMGGPSIMADGTFVYGPSRDGFARTDGQHGIASAFDEPSALRDAGGVEAFAVGGGKVFAFYSCKVNDVGGTWCPTAGIYAEAVGGGDVSRAVALPPSVFATKPGPTIAMAVAGKTIVWADPRAGGFDVLAVDLESGAAPRTILQTRDLFFGMVTDDTHVFTCVRNNTGGRMLQTDTTTGATEEIGSLACRSPQRDGDRVWWLEGDPTVTYVRNVVIKR